MEKKVVAIVFIIVVISTFWVVEQRKTAELQHEVVWLQTYIDSLENQAKELHEVHGELRTRVINVSNNLSMTTAERNACEAQLTQFAEYRSVTKAPQKRVALSDLTISNTEATIQVDNLVPGIIAPTGSMYPVLEQDNIVLEKIPQHHNDIFPGDIIIYTYGEQRIIHRVIQVGFDENGWYAVAKGDNNIREDPFKIRFPQIKGVVVGIIY